MSCMTFTCLVVQRVCFKNILSDGMSAARWEARSRQGMCVGMSDEHAGDFLLILNFMTGDIIAQWSMVFDNWFSTVATNINHMPEFHANMVKDVWNQCV